MSDKKIYIILIFLITLIGGFLRFYKLPQLTTLSAEQGDNYLAIKNLAENKQIPLVGPPTSHEWLSFGPLFYYLMTPIMLIANYTPLAPAYFFALIYTAIIPINYIVINKIFNKQTALLSSLFISVSPLWLHFSRAARFYCSVPFIFYFLLWFIAKKKKNFFVIGLLIGVMLNFHLSPLFIIPAVLSYFWMTKTKINWKLLSVGFLIPLLPLIIHDSLSGFKMISQFLLWIPYRIAGFLNLYPKNNLTPVTLKQTIINFYQFFQYSFFPKNFPWQISTSIYLVFAYLFLFNSKKLNFQKTRKLILLIFGWGILSLLIHSQPPLHYFLPLFPIPPILFAYFLVKLGDFQKYSLQKILIPIFLIIITIPNFLFYFSSEWFYHPTDTAQLNPLYIPYPLQRQAAAIIVHDAKERNFHISRIGPYDHFENDFADNYYYLAWLMGKEPVYSKKEADVVYRIIEDPKQFPASTKTNELLIKVGSMGILRKRY